MRLSTQSYYSNSIRAMLDQQSALSRIQNQVASGRKINSPADDPIAAVHIMELERSKLEGEQYGKNVSIARSRLNLTEQSLADAGNVLQRVRELTLQGANVAAMTDADRVSLAVELEARLKEMQDIANVKDSNGEYLFAGFSTRTQPFTGAESGNAAYMGDQGSRLLQVGQTQRVPDSFSGYDVFMRISSGNGIFDTAAGAGNTGSGVIDTGSVTSVTAWVPDNYTLTFTSATTWEVTDSAAPTPNIVASGAYTSGGAIDFNGAQVRVSGAPAAGDTYSISASTNEDVFTTLYDVVNALRQPGGNAAAYARISSALNGSIEQVDQAMEHFLGMRAQVGARLSQLDSADAALEDRSIDIQASLSDLRDLDYAEALARMQQQMVGLQAAQLSYSQISQLSLFNYLR